MAILTSSDKVTIHIASGVVTEQDFMEKIRFFYEEAPTKHILWDLREADMGSLTSGSAERIARYVAEMGKKYKDVRIGGKSAFVAASDLEFGLLREYEMHGGERLPSGVAVFREMAAAIEWLLDE